MSVQSADHFAKGAISILHRLGVEKLVFGTEEMLDYQKIADIYVDKSEEMENFVKNLPDNLSYPQKTQAMWQEFAGLTFTGDTPNHILGLAYAKAVAGTGIQLGPVQRQGLVFTRKRWKRPTPRRRLSERVLTNWTWYVTFTVCQSL